MEKILISGCLIGQKVRYHGGDAFCNSLIIDQWQNEGRVISICPEVSAGLLIPRPSSEIVGGTGDDVLENKAQVITHTGINRTNAFIIGANNALSIAQKHHIRIALLKKNSPSCGNTTIYDGSYSGQLINGSGVTAALLKKNGIEVFNESQLTDAVQYLKYLDSIIS